MSFAGAVLACQACATVADPTVTGWRCGCSGLWDLHWHPPGPWRPEPTVWSQWRYGRHLPFDGPTSWADITMGEGMTPLVPAAGASPAYKLDHVMPTGSFKDRGAAVLLAVAHELGATSVVCDSSGNAGTSVAAYAARAGIAATVFVPQSTSPKKTAQMVAHGARVERVAGPRAAAAAAAQEALDRHRGAFYASHVYNPFFLQGTKLWLYEVFEQWGRLPATLVVPVGNGTLVLGAAQAVADLRAFGCIEVSPRIIGVQAARCAPLAAATGASATAWGPTAAEGIAIAEPPRAAQVVDAVLASGGRFITAAEDDIAPARHSLAARGIYVEPTSAATEAAWQQAVRTGEVDDPGDAVLVLCGTGLKTG